MKLKKHSLFYKKRVRLNIDRLEEAIERTRAGLLEQLEQAGYNFNDLQVVRSSQTLDRLLNLYYLCKKRPGQ